MLYLIWLLKNCCSKKNRISAGRLEYEKGMIIIREYSFNTRRLASIEL